LKVFAHSQSAFSSHFPFHSLVVTETYVASINIKLGKAKIAEIGANRLRSRIKVNGEDI
jgi:hypothetical protein